MRFGRKALIKLAHNKFIKREKRGILGRIYLSRNKRKSGLGFLMGNTTDNIYTLQAVQGAGCRIAYIIDNRQPVKCSIISDQPLFYMDFEDEYETDEDAGVFDFTAIEESVASLHARIENLSGMEGRNSGNPPEERFERFMENMEMATRPFEAPIPPDMRFLENTLNQSRLAAAFLDFASRYGTRLNYDAQVAGAVYDRRDGQIYINPHISRENQILLAIRELRRVWQHRNGALLNPLTFHPDQAILVNRAQIADLTVMIVRVAWELQLAGEKAVWERVENSAMADLARAFARESFLDFRTLNNGIAQSAVFESWFLSERCRTEDKKLIQLMLADYQGYVFGADHAMQQVTAELIIALGSMPFGKNYLAPYVNTIINDAIFTEVRDRSNANFLWFIKFERSFRETEQELQNESDVSGHDNHHGRINNKNKRFGDHEETSEIITLTRGEQTAAPSETGGAQGDNVVQFRQSPAARQRSGEA